MRGPHFFPLQNSTAFSVRAEDTRSCASVPWQRVASLFSNCQVHFTSWRWGDVWYVHPCLCQGEHRGRQSTSQGVPLYHSWIYSLETRFLTEANRPQGPSCGPPTILDYRSPCLASFMCSTDLNSAPPGCEGSYRQRQSSSSPSRTFNRE